MRSFVLLFLLTKLGNVYSQLSLLDNDQCKISKGCWFQPPNCVQGVTAKKNVSGCYSMLKWSKTDTRLQLELQADLTDKRLRDHDMGKYIAVGFSLDKFMGSDTVVECVAKPSGKVSVYVSWNDGTHNYRLHQATEVLLENSEGAIIEGKLVCRTSWVYSGLRKVQKGSEDKFNLFDLQYGRYHFQMVRGLADPRTDQLKIHSTVDGPLFPWMSQDQYSLSFIENDGPLISSSSAMRQSHIERWYRYRMTVTHGILMIFGWWVFGGTAVLMARYFKPMWHTSKLCGKPVWFQFHRSMMIFSVILQTIGIILIFVQADRLYLCTEVCNREDYALFLHAIMGIVATGLALIQPFLAWCRPDPNAKRRSLFNWIHWFLGMSAFTIATVVIFLSISLGKTGLGRNFGFKPDYLMGGYILTFVLIGILLEIIRTTKRSSETEINEATVAMQVFNGPNRASADNRPKYSGLSKFLLVIFFFSAVAFSSGISYMLLYILRNH